MPPHLRDTDPQPGQLGWQAWAEPVVGGPYLWCASFRASVPHDLAAIFASSLASPHPVPRSTLLAGVEGRLTVMQQGVDRQRRARRSE
ncbi:DUF317 domain-containing protein [Streptomyces sp. NPDC057426]|uniref:DUF317 domain-containing protein n=1 Tax=Streptomyces sp. NPDC057426 TaxID=3346128 RepID=UPI0036BB5273